jgi:hypothetical protein
MSSGTQRARKPKRTFDPSRFGKKEAKHLELKDFGELNLSPNGIVLMLLASCSRKRRQHAQLGAARAGVEEQMRAVRDKKAELVARRMGLRKFKKSTKPKCAPPSLPPVLRRALQPPPGPAALKRAAGTGSGPAPAPPPRELARQRAAVKAGRAAVATQPPLPASIVDFADPERWSNGGGGGGVRRPTRIAANTVAQLANALPLPLPLVEAMNMAACGRSGSEQQQRRRQQQGEGEGEDDEEEEARRAGEHSSLVTRRRHGDGGGGGGGGEPLHAAAAPAAELRRLLSRLSLLHAFDRDALDPYGVAEPWLRGERNWRDGGSRRLVWRQRARFPPAGLVHVPAGGEGDGVDPKLAAARRALERQNAQKAQAKAAGFESVEEMLEARAHDGERGAAIVIQRPWKRAVMRMRVRRAMVMAAREASRRGDFDWGAPWYRLEEDAAAELAAADAKEAAEAEAEAEAERAWRAAKEAEARELAAERAGAAGWESPKKAGGGFDVAGGAEEAQG